MKIVKVTLGQLRAHSASIELFGDPTGAPEYADIRASIERDGLLDPLVVTPDGRVVSGCLRLMALLEVHGADYELWVQQREFANATEELVHVVKTNLMRRNWSPRSRAAAFRAVRTTLPEDGGTKQKRGRRKKGSDRGTLPKGIKSDEAAARMLGLGKHEARALDLIYSAAGVPDQLKAAVEAGKVSPTRAAGVIRQALSNGGGSITDLTPLCELAASATARTKRNEVGSEPPTQPCQDLTAERECLTQLLQLWGQAHGHWRHIPLNVFARAVVRAVGDTGSDDARANRLLENLERLATKPTSSSHPGNADASVERQESSQQP